VLNAIENGGTGQGRMPAGLLQGEDAEDVAAYVASVAGQ
jgi:mono/diheme cytochrome c family protein